jgi:trk system potassium uptake protein TrkH
VAATGIVRGRRRRGGALGVDVDAALDLVGGVLKWVGPAFLAPAAVAVLPRLRVGGRRLLQAELAGPAEIEPLTATIRQTARRLWALYMGLSGVATLALAALGWLGLDRTMDLFDAFSYATSAVALGGFAPRDGSASTLAPVTQWVLCATMLTSGVNFLRLFRLLVQRQVRAVSRDEELRLYLCLFVLAAALLLVEVLADGVATGAAAVRATAFQAVSTMTTTGLAVADYTRWGALATMTLLLLMFVGASAGSTGGSIKVVRHLLLFRIVRRELLTAAHADMVVPVRVNGLAVDERALRSAIGFVALYLLTFALGSLGLVIVAQHAHSGLGVFDAIGASASCLGNVGAGFGFAGPFGSYASFSDLSTAILTVLMWLGRIEIIPVAVVLTRSYWRG